MRAPLSSTWSAGLGAVAVLLGASAPGAPAAPPPATVEGRREARLSVTVDPDSTGTILVPSPFTVVPGSGRIALHVPESDGIFLLRGETILHHFPLGDRFTELDDLEASEDLLVAGRCPPSGRTTVDLAVFDLHTGKAVDVISSANPNLRVDFESADLWRVVVEGDRVGVYQPVAEATYPLWERGGTQVIGADQMGQAATGIGFADGEKLIPRVDGSVSVRERATTRTLAPAGEGEFLDPVPGGGALFLQPAVAVRADADGDFLLPHELAVRLLGPDGKRTDFLLSSVDRDVSARRLVFQGRPVCVRGERVYWIFLGADYLEIRSADLSELAARGG